MIKNLLAAALGILLAACTNTVYWTKPGVPLQDTAKDLSDCRLKANVGGEKVFSPMQIEGPCMTGKGYTLSDRPPPLQ